MVLLLLAAGAENGADLGNLPADPAKAWAVIISMLAVPVGAVITALIKRKQTATNEANTPAPSAVINGSVTPHIDATQALLATVVGNTEERARLLEAKYDELDKRHLATVRVAARAELQVEMLKERVAELEAEVNVLTGRLRERTGQ